jgi:hypothetical protein
MFVRLLYVLMYLPTFVVAFMGLLSVWDLVSGCDFSVSHIENTAYSMYLSTVHSLFKLRRKPYIEYIE